jgi:putative oligomerization/nucleic acid binding protein
MSFWDVFWLIVWSFLFIAYLMVLFNVLIDLFRDHELSGWVKAVWVFFLVVFPAITALVYLIARGQGMAQRSDRAVRQAKSETDAYIRSVSTSSPAEQIATAKQLLDQGTITEAEFDQLKTKALSTS